jgi:DNA-binding PadR family transcriptional regulator
MLFDKERSPRMGGPVTRHGGQVRHHHNEERTPGGPHGPGGPFGPGGLGGHGPFRGRRGPGGGFGGPGRGRMTRRGDVRIAILALLGEKPMHGYQVISELDTRTGGRWRPSAGSIYPTLQQLEDEGLVRGEEIDGRRVFSLTDAGTAEAARRGTTGSAPWQTDPTAGDDPAFELRRLSFAVGAAAMQVVEVGSPGSIEQAREILADARRRLYRLLAEDETPAAETTPTDR